MWLERLTMEDWFDRDRFVRRGFSGWVRRASGALASSRSTAHIDYNEVQRQSTEEQEVSGVPGSGHEADKRRCGFSLGGAGHRLARGHTRLDRWVAGLTP
jgi:hypothetical protein